jgi:tetratricopeptide (TPR) repeat protein
VVLNNEISYNRQGVFLDQASALLAGNQILFNQQRALWAQQTSLSALKIDLNFFGPPQQVQVFSSHPEQKTGQLAVLETPDHRGPRRPLAMSPFAPGQAKTELSLLVTAGGPVSDTAKAETPPPAAEKPPAAAAAKPPAQTPESAAKAEGKARPALDAFIEGVSAARKEDYRKAVTLLDLALAEPSREAEARFWLGYCYLQTGELKKAVFNYNKAAQLAPDNNEYLLHLGTALHLSGETAKAKIVYQEVLRRDPKNPDAREVLDLLKETGS